MRVGPGSVSLIWPSTSVSQRHADDSLRWEGGRDKVQETVEGDEITVEMSRLDLSSSPSPSHVDWKQQPQTEDDPHSSDRHLFSSTSGHVALNSTMSLHQASIGVSSASAPSLTRKAAGHGRAKTAKGRQRPAKDEDLGLSPGLLGVIFRDIAKRKGGTRYAQLAMNSSGRWRIVRHHKPSDVFPSTSR